MQDEAFRQMNSQKNYFHPERSFSSSISSSRTSSIYGSHIYELTQFSTRQICDICDKLIDSKKPLNGLNRNILYVEISLIFDNRRNTCTSMS